MIVTHHRHPARHQLRPLIQPPKINHKIFPRHPIVSFLPSSHLLSLCCRPLYDSWFHTMVSAFHVPLSGSSQARHRSFSFSPRLQRNTSAPSAVTVRSQTFVISCSLFPACVLAAPAKLLQASQNFLRLFYHPLAVLIFIPLIQVHKFRRIARPQL